MADELRSHALPRPQSPDVGEIQGLGHAALLEGGFVDLLPPQRRGGASGIPPDSFGAIGLAHKQKPGEAHTLQPGKKT